MGEASHVIDIKIERDGTPDILGVFQENCINKILERFCMKDCSPGVPPIVRSDKFSLNQYPSNDWKREEMKNIPYNAAIGSFTYAQIGTRPDIAYVVGMLGRYQSNLGLKN